jgi:RNA polymerase sigma-70 factor, ECF subfamily
MSVADALTDDRSAAPGLSRRHRQLGKGFPPILLLCEVDQDLAVTTRRELERLYREDGGRLWWAVLAYTGDRDVASDSVAEAFAQALGRGAAIRSPLAWIWRTAFRVAAAEMKRRRLSYPLGDQQGYEMTDLSDVVFALGKLSPSQRAAVVLHYYADYPLKDVAAILGIATATAGVHLHRGRRKLRDLLEEDDA